MSSRVHWVTDVEENVFIHPSALVESDAIGEGSRVWAFAHVMRGARIGKDCNIGDHAFLESGVTLGDAVTVKNGVSIWEGVEIGDRCFIGPNASFTNDLFPRSKVYHEEVVRTILEEGVSIGANATIVAGITIGKYAMIGAGAVVIRDVSPFELVVGNPARRIGWVSRKGSRLNFTEGVCEVDGDRYSLNSNELVQIT